MHVTLTQEKHRFPWDIAGPGTVKPQLLEKENRQRMVIDKVKGKGAFVNFYNDGGKLATIPIESKMTISLLPVYISYDFHFRVDLQKLKMGKIEFNVTLT
jgi:hypothetical protein